MIIGQLWYGWARRGAEGTDQEQIIAGSGNLGDRGSRLTQFVLRWCYNSERPACGWVERDGVLVAFRRTPTGKDVLGRSGAFFVHALVLRAGLMPSDRLAGLWDAQVWLTAPPDDPPSRLEPLEGIDALGLGTPSPAGDDELTRLLAGHLANTASGRGSAIQQDAGTAMAFAAAMAAALPMAYGLPAFSSYEQAGNASDYDILAAPAPEEHFAAIGPRMAPDGPSLRAAGVLVAASRGDLLAQDVVAAITEGNTSARGFAEELRRWALLDERPPQASAGQIGAALELAASDPRLVRALVQRGATAALARGILGGDGARRLMAAAERAGCVDAVVEGLGAELLARPRMDAWAALQRIRKSLPDVAPGLASTLAGSWLESGQLAALPADDAVALARLLARSPSSARTNAAAHELLTSPACARALADDELLPGTWRGRAAATNPDAISTERLVDSVIREPDFAASLLHSASVNVHQALASAMASAATSVALRCVESATPHLPRSMRGDLLWPVIARLPTAERYRTLNLHAPEIADDGGRWAEGAVDAYVEMVIAQRDTDAALPALHPAAFRHAGTDRGRAWKDLAGLLARWRLTRNARAAEISAAAWVVRAMPDDRDADAGLEALLDAAAEDAAQRHHALWLDSMSRIMTFSVEHDQAFACRLSRTATRVGLGGRSSVALWTILWIADRLDDQRLDSGVLDDEHVGRLPLRLRQHHLELLAARVKVQGTRSTTRRWLRATEKAAAKNLR